MVRTALMFCVCVSMAAASDVTGKWDFTAQTPEGQEFKADLTLRSDGGKLAGTLGSSQGSAELQDVNLASNDLTFKLPLRGSAYAIKLTVAGDSMKGTYSAPDGSSGKIVATRAAGATPAPAAVSNGVAGTWKVLARSSDGREYKLELMFSVEGGELRGTVTNEEGTAGLIDPKLDGSTLTFQISARSATYDVKLIQTGDSLSGTYAGPAGEKGTLTGKR